MKKQNFEKNVQNFFCDVINSEEVGGDDAAKDLFKSFNNGVLGKTMENLRKRMNSEVETSIALKRIARPNFTRAKIYREDLVGIHMAKVMSRSIQVGFAILDLSKFSCMIFIIIRG